MSVMLVIPPSLPTLPTLNLHPVTVLALAIFVSYVLYLHLKNPLSRIPAVHWSAPFCRLYYLYIIYSNNRRQTTLDAHRNLNEDGVFRPVVRVGPNEVSIMTTEGIKTVFDGGFERPTWYHTFMNFGTQNMFSFQSSQQHSTRRRIYAKHYSKSAVSGPHVQTIIKSRLSKLVQFLSDQTNRADCGTSSPLVVCNLFRALEADVLSAFAFSELDGTSYLDRLDQSGKHSMEHLGMQKMDLFHEDKRGQFFFWEAESPFTSLNRFFAPEAQVAHQNAEEWVANIIDGAESRYNSISCPMEREWQFGNSVYGKLLAWRDQKNAALTWNERASEIMDHVGAGQDSVPMVLEFVLRTLSTHPQMQARLRAELAESLPHDLDDCAFNAIDSLPYLNAVVLESLRLVDTIESCQSRVVPKGGCVVEGYYLPEGTIVSAQPYVLHRQENIFPDPEKFNPDRWLMDKESLRPLLKSLLTFSTGPRGCIGKQLALAVMKTSLTNIYKTFTTELVNGQKLLQASEPAAMAEIRFQRLC